MPLAKHKLFLKSSVHYALIAASLIGFLAVPNLAIGAIVGLATYVLGWVYLPDLPIYSKRLEVQAQTNQLQAIPSSLHAELSKTSSLASGLRDRAEKFHHTCLKMLEELSTGTTPQSVVIHVGGQLIELLKQYVGLLLSRETMTRYIGSNSLKDLQNRLTAVEKQLLDYSPESRIYTVTLETKSNLEKQLQYHNLLEENIELVTAELSRLEESLNLYLLELKQTKATDSITANIDDVLQNLSSTNESLSQISQLTNTLPGLPRPVPQPLQQ